MMSNPLAARVKITQSGIMGGVTLAELWGAYVTKESWNIGGWAGAYVLIPVADNFHFRPEINYNMRGYHYFYDNINNPMGEKNEAMLRLNYVDFPMLFQFAVTVNESLAPDVVFGPYVGWNVSSQSKIIIGELEHSEVENNIRKYDLGVIAGSRLLYAGHFYINLRGGAGLISIVDKTNPPRKYNLWVLAGLEYRF